MSYKQTEAPAEEPVTLAEAKVFCQAEADDTTHDALIEDILIPTARQACEARTGRALITQKWRRTLDGFPCGGGPIELERAPLVSVQSVKYLDTAGVQQTVDPAVYVVDKDHEPGRIGLAFGQVWPPALWQIASVEIAYTAGYGDEGDDVPAGLKHWILARVRGMFELRGESVELMRGQLAKPNFIDGLLDGFTIHGA